MNQEQIMLYILLGFSVAIVYSLRIIIENQRKILKKRK